MASNQQPVWEPTEAEIAAECAKIRAERAANDERHPPKQRNASDRTYRLWCKLTETE